MSFQVIPLSNDPNYYFNISLDNNQYKISIRWSAINEAWYMGLEGVTDSTIVAKGIKLVCGVDLLAPYAFTDLGSMYMIDVSDQLTDPDYDNFGDRYVLAYEPK